MNKALLLFISLSTFAITGFSQDIITLKSGEEIKARVTDVGLEIIKYQKYENVSGPNYSLEKSKVFMVKYENGTKDVFANLDKAHPKDLQREGDLTIQGNRTYINDERIRSGELRSVLFKNSEANKVYYNGLALYYVGVGIGATGAIILCYNLADGVINQNFDVGATILGGGLMITGIVIESIGIRARKKGFNIYNSGRKSSVKFDFGINSKGVGISMMF